MEFLDKTNKTMKAIVVADSQKGNEGMTLKDVPMAVADLNDVVVQVYASGFTGNELTWPSTWADRAGRDRTPSIPGHEFAGVVVELGYGTTGVSIGQRVFGLTDWTRNGTLAEYVAVESRNLAPLPADVDFKDGAALVMSGLTAWQGLYVHGNLQAGQTVLIHGAAGIVGSMAVQLARSTGAYVVGTGHTSGRQVALDFGVHKYIDLDTQSVEESGEVDLVFDVFGGEIAHQSAALVRNGGRLITIAGPSNTQPANGTTIDFVVEAIPAQLEEVVQLFRQGKIKTNIGTVAHLNDAVAALNKLSKGKTIIYMQE